jgi:hypothetical protein
MDDKLLQKLAEQASGIKKLTTPKHGAEFKQGLWTIDVFDRDLYSRLIIDECHNKMRSLAHELSGVLSDLEAGGKFDVECLRSVTYVKECLEDPQYLKDHFKKEKED